ncbi:MAG: peptidoglycan DD-metalloendopeptidase family protein [Thermoleophilaceae bacterium]|nr:peptidoglycan DD-metalloendopeptidase family protein [Thermoleophilaceae bacterium]
MLALAPSAAGQSAKSPGGGAVYLTKPKVTSVSCFRGCASGGRARAGSTLKVLGSGLLAVNRVVFRGGAGASDDADVAVRSGSDARVHARVPVGAVSGPITAVTADGVGSKPSAPIPILPAPPPPRPTRNPKLTPVPGAGVAGAPLLETGTNTTKAYVDARPGVTFWFRVSGTAPSSVTVDLLNAADGTTVKTWSPQVVPGAVQSVSWSGRIGRAAAPPGRYSFRLTAAGADGAQARSAQTAGFDRDSFDLYDHVFPVRGRHDFGGAGSRFGAGRAGHSHQGHDVFAGCGTRLVAARGGRVQYRGYHGAAGNYIVIDGAGTDVDYAYMHLAAPSPFAAGGRVYTGQLIGAVGETGNARGCHLHFETWAAPGWYEGGKPFDPLPSLIAWDSWS